MAAVAGLVACTAWGCGDDASPAPVAFSAPPSLAYDARAPLDVQLQRTVRRGDLRVEKLTYVGAGGERVPTLIARPVGRRARGCVIWEHGLGSTKEQSRIAWEGLARLGLTTFSIDLRHHGERARGFPASLATDVRDPATVLDMVRGTTLDLRRGLDLLETRPECEHNIGYVGWSLGGIIGSVLAGVDHRVKAVALLSVPGSWRALLQTTDDLLPGVEKRPAAFAAALRLLSPYDPDQWVADISPRPLLLMHGNRDAVVSQTAAEDLTASATQPVTSIPYDGGHDPFTGPAAVNNGVVITDFLRRNLARTSAVPAD